MKNNTKCSEHPFYERPLKSENIYDGRVVHLFRDDVELSDGSRSVREVIRHNGAVCVLPLTDDGRVACVTQYRHAIGRLTLELPAGKLDTKDEDPESAARRELKEETGYECDKITSLGIMHGSPAILDEAIHLYLATGLRRGKATPDEGEFLDVNHLPLSELADMVMRGEITDAKTQIAVLKVYFNINNGGEQQ